MNCSRVNFLNEINNCSGDNITSLSTEEYNAIQEECAHYENMRAASIEALKIVQKKRGWVSDDVMILIAQILCIPVADLEGVATFYNQIFRQPVGRHIVRYCDSVVCYLFGCEKIKDVLINILDITVGNTTIDDRFTLLPICCVGHCNKAPILMINEDIYCNVIPENVIQLLENYL